MRVLLLLWNRRGRLVTLHSPASSYFLLAATLSHAAAGREKPGIIPGRTAAGLHFIPGGCQLATVRDELSGAYRK